MKIRSLRVRMVLFLVALLGAVQVAEFALTDNASYSAARGKIEDELTVGERVFARVLRQNAEQQAQSSAVLASDFAFREAVATGDVGTLESALENHGARIKARAVLYVDLQGRVVADTLRPGAPARPFELAALIAQARSQGNATAIDSLDGQVFQLIAVPVRAPVTIGWIVMGFPVDGTLASDLKQLTGLQVSFMVAAGNHWQPLASTLPSDWLGAVEMQLPPYAAALGTRMLQLPMGAVQLRVLSIGGEGSEHIVAVLQRPLDTALATFRMLRTTLIVLGVLSLLASLVGSVLIALGITRPIEQLLGAVQNIRRGDYSKPIEVVREDEIGVLAHGLEHMRSGIADREQKILKLAYEDTLTQLPNRAHFAEALRRGVDKARLESGSLAVLMMDLDRFKYINDTLGHNAGDHVLREVGVRLRALLQPCDGIARLGGDEFALLIPGLAREQVQHLALRIINTFEQPISFQDQPLDVGTSIGIAFFPEHGEDAEKLLRNADIAMYVSKRGKSGHTIYDPNYDTSQQEHLSLLGELRRAVDKHELRLYYQPKVTLARSSVMAAEALIRWNHPTRGVVPPNHFIPFAEHTGYIKVLTRWVLQEAIRQCAEWSRQGVEIQISVNISARDLMNRELPDFVSEQLARYGVDPRMLCLEITESGFMEDPAHAQRVLEQLSRIGLQLSIDDYGTGYSSLSYIMQLPVTELKIDRAFVSQISENPDLATIVSSTIELGHSLGLKVVAEGVEDGTGLELLRRLGCDSAQGYFMSPPLPAESFLGWLNNSLPSRHTLRVPAAMGSDGTAPDSDLARLSSSQA